MLGNAVHRSHNETTVAFASGASQSAVVDIGDYDKGYFQTPAALNGATMKFLVSCDETATTFTTARTAAGTADESVTVGISKGYPVPSSVMQARFLKLLAASAQTTPRTVRMVLKG